MKKTLSITTLLLLVAGYIGTASAASLPCRSPEWNVWVESQLSIRSTYPNLEIGSTSWQQAVEGKLKAKGWPARNSVLWCAVVEKALSSKSS
ncbi:hypothetical protein [Musicola keenii]|uniref:hypothetical protein n=1 Tax=Musicola keenii TaxID=2884250 RepID=UPI001783A92A|nr:hypothetical protein [Musicola keenii]